MKGKSFWDIVRAPVIAVLIVIVFILISWWGNLHP